MKEKNLQFDRSKHLLYSKAVKSVIKAHLAMHYPPDQSADYWEQIQLSYVRMLDLIPYMGGKKNSQSAAVYDCAAHFEKYCR